MRIGSLFTGTGALDLAVADHYGAEVAWHIEYDTAPSKVLAHHYPGIPNFGDITAVDWSAVEPVDIITGGFPCSDVSHAGLRRGVHHGTRSGLWFEMARAIDQLKPWKVVIENVAGLLSATAAGDVEPCPWCLGDGAEGAVRALGAVLADLAEMGYVGRWGSVRAADAGAPHRRERVFIVATNTDRRRHEQRLRQDVGTVPVAADRRDPRDQGGDLTLMPTPKASDGPNGEPGMRNGRGVADALPGVVALLPTPAARDHKGESLPSRDGGQALPDVTDFGPYTPAIRRWEAVLGRPAPAPTEPGANGRHRLSASFVEHLMGLPDGWVTGVPGVSRSAQLKALGNGVIPQQAALALQLLDGAR